MSEAERSIALATEIVKKRIKGTRKGSDEPAFQHSIRVFELLRSHCFSDDVCVAGLLHDILEDGDTKFEELIQLGFTQRVVELVCLCSHDDTIASSDARWAHMMGSLIEANDREVWAIKVADLTDNLASSHLLASDRREFMLTIKAPLLLRLTRELLGIEPIWFDLKAALELARGK